MNKCIKPLQVLSIVRWLPCWLVLVLMMWTLLQAIAILALDSIWFLYDQYVYFSGKQ